MRYYKHVALTVIFLLGGCTVVTEKDYLHKDTASLRRMSVHALGDIRIDQPFVFVPNFRTFAWEDPSYPSLFIISEKALTVQFEKATLKGPDGTAEATVQLDESVTLQRARRQTTLGERQASGGFFKGERMTDAIHFSGRLTLPFSSKAFNTLTPLQLEVIASVDGGAYETYRFELSYRERRSPTFITR